MLLPSLPHCRCVRTPPTWSIIPGIARQWPLIIYFDSMRRGQLVVLFVEFGFLGIYLAIRIGVLSRFSTNNWLMSCLFLSHGWCLVKIGQRRNNDDGLDRDRPKCIFCFLNISINVYIYARIFNLINIHMQLYSSTLIIYTYKYFSQPVYLWYWWLAVDRHTAHHWSPLCKSILDHVNIW